MMPPSRKCQPYVEAMNKYARKYVPSADGSETVLQDASQVFDEGSSRMSSLRMPYTDKPSTSTPGPMCADLGGDGADGVKKFLGLEGEHFWGSTRAWVG